MFEILIYIIAYMITLTAGSICIDKLPYEMTAVELFFCVVFCWPLYLTVNVITGAWAMSLDEQGVKTDEVPERPWWVVPIMLMGISMNIVWIAGVVNVVLGRV